MMKKTTSALAVAALMTAGTASSMEEFVVNDTTTASIFGGVFIAAVNEEDGTGSTESDVGDNGTTLGFVFESRLPNGMSAFAHLEEDGFDAADDGETEQKTDEAYLGLKGNFGTVQFGRNDSIYDDMITDNFDYQDVLAPTGYGDTRERALQFYSSDVGGFSVALEAGINGDQDEATEVDTNAFPPNGSDRDADGNTGDSVSLAGAASYTVDAVTVTGAIDQRGNDLGGDFGGDNVRYVDSPIYGLVGSIDLNPLAISVGYQKAEEATASETIDTDIFSVDAQYAYNNGKVYGTYQAVDIDNDPDGKRDEIVLGVKYGIGQIYGTVEYLALDRDQDDGDAMSVGVGYNF